MNRDKEAAVKAAGDPVPAGIRARQAGLQFRRYGPYHWQIITYDGSGWVHWIYNLYPSNGRIYIDPHYRGPFLHLPYPWTFRDVVEAVIAERKKHEVRSDDVGRREDRRVARKSDGQLVRMSGRQNIGGYRVPLLRHGIAGLSVVADRVRQALLGVWRHAHEPRHELPEKRR